MLKDFDTWNKRKKDIDTSEFSGYPNEREVWWCSLGVNIGVEADGKNENFERPVLILKKYNRHSVLAVCLTSKIQSDNAFLMTYEHKGEKLSANLSQVKTISTRRLLRLMYRMNSKTFREIKETIKSML